MDLYKAILKQMLLEQQIKKLSERVEMGNADGLTEQVCCQALKKFEGFWAMTNWTTLNALKDSCACRKKLILTAGTDAILDKENALSGFSYG